MMRNAVSESETTRLTITWSKEADHALRAVLAHVSSFRTLV